MSHYTSAFNNSCVKVPVDPLSKMPVTDYERKAKRIEQRANKNKRLSIESDSTVCSLSKADADAKQVREFYQSIPDYNDINHLTQDEFYSTLKCLREKKRQMLGYSVSHIDDLNGHDLTCENTEGQLVDLTKECTKLAKCKLNESIKTTYEHDGNTFTSVRDEYSSNIKKITDDLESILTDVVVPERTATIHNHGLHTDGDHGLKRATSTRELSPKNAVNIETPKESNIRSESRAKRNHSACSISWNDQCASNVNDEVDSRFEKYFISHSNKAGKERKSRSMPSSPVKVRRTLSPNVYKKHAFTVPKPFNMTLRDDDERAYSSLKCLSKSFSDEMLHRKAGRRRFRARAVPVESRIPLYDRIVEDQAMRRAISKINSTAELQAQMKPFSFTEREERAGGRGARSPDARAPADAAPAGAAPNKFRARPIPKNLFSNGVYEKMREENFYRALNRRIRAEELLRAASLPPSMAARDKPGRSRSRVSTPGALLSDLPTDTASELSGGKPPPAPAAAPARRARKGRRSGRKKDAGKLPQEFITTSPQPFHFSTATRAYRKEDLKKIYSKSQSSPEAAAGGSAQARPLSALEMPSVNRSNLAAVLRIESTKKRLGEEVGRRLAEREHRAELRWRDHILRKKPAWQLVRNNYEEDIAMRLQTRRDEERLRREEFLHQMELMYGRVREQPLLFERYYTCGKPRRDDLDLDQLDVGLPCQSSHRKKSSRRGTKSAPQRHTTPSNSRKVSINETAETINDEFIDYLDRMGEGDKMFSETESLCGANSTKNENEI